MNVGKCMDAWWMLPHTVLCPACLYSALLLPCGPATRLQFCCLLASPLQSLSTHLMSLYLPQGFATGAARGDEVESGIMPSSPSRMELKVTPATCLQRLDHVHVHMHMHMSSQAYHMLHSRLYLLPSRLFSYLLSLPACNSC
jgi:hypothetical protein